MSASHPLRTFNARFAGTKAAARRCCGQRVAAAPSADPRAAAGSAGSERAGAVAPSLPRQQRRVQVDDAVM
jgi:hypothetical protein